MVFHPPVSSHDLQRLGGEGAPILKVSDFPYCYGQPRPVGWETKAILTLNFPHASHSQVSTSCGKRHLLRTIATFIWTTTDEACTALNRCRGSTLVLKRSHPVVSSLHIVVTSTLGCQKLAATRKTKPGQDD